MSGFDESMAKASSAAEIDSAAGVVLGSNSAGYKCAGLPVLEQAGRSFSDLKQFLPNYERAVLLRNLAAPRNRRPVPSRSIDVGSGTGTISKFAISLLPPVPV